MNEDNLLLTVAVIAVAISVVAAGITYFSVASLVSKISGLATGEANLTLESSAVINFTTSSVNWSSGRVNFGSNKSELETVGSGSVSDGNWTAASGFIVENIGNNNVSFNLSVGKTAANFVGGSSAAYEWNVSQIDPGTCMNSSCSVGSSGTFLDSFIATNTTTTQFCGCMAFTSGNDSMRIDLNVTVSEDSTTGDLGDVITATIVAIT